VTITVRPVKSSREGVEVLLCFYGSFVHDPDGSRRRWFLMDFAT
jgi:hypothetical protein